MTLIWEHDDGCAARTEHDPKPIGPHMYKCTKCGQLGYEVLVTTGRRGA